MNAYKANMINALVLIGVSIFRFLQDGKGNVVLLTPIIISVVLLALSNGIYYAIRAQVKAVLVVTLTLLFILLSFVIQDGHSKGTLFTICMAVSCFISVFYVSKSLLYPTKRHR